MSGKNVIFCYSGTGNCLNLAKNIAMLPLLNIKKAQDRSERIAQEIATDVKQKKVVKRKPSRNLLNVLENKLWPVIAKVKEKEDSHVRVFK